MEQGKYGKFTFVKISGLYAELPHKKENQYQIYL